MITVVPKKPAYCPVAELTNGPDETTHRYPLGYLQKNEKCAFVCRECQFIYTWNEKGSIISAVKIIERKEVKGCDCGGCQYRDEHKRFRNNDCV